MAAHHDREVHARQRGVVEVRPRKRLGDETRKYLASPEAKAAYDKLGHEAYGSPGEEVMALVRAEHAKYSVAVREAKVSAK